MAKEKTNIAEENAVKEEAKVDKATIIIPLVSKNDPDYWCCINEESYLIKRGVPVEVPVHVAKFISQQMEDEANVLANEAAIASRSV